MRRHQHHRRRRYRLVLAAVAVVAALVVLGGIDLGYLGPDVKEPAHLIAMPNRARSTFTTPDPALTLDPTDTPTPEIPQPVQPRNEPPPQAPAAPAPGWTGPPATTPAEAVQHAVAVAQGRTTRSAAVILDRRTGIVYGAGSPDAPFASASLVKVFIATRLLIDGQAADPGIRDLMWQMIVASDDDAASALYPIAGYEDLIGWISNRYGISGLAPASIHNYWGLTQITARAMVTFYAKIANDPAVGPWLLDAMANAQATGSDGFPQYFGIPSAAAHWRIKQGWMCCLENVTRMHSTGFVDDRYTVALLTEGPRAMYGSYGAQTLTAMAEALLPDGTVPQSGPLPPETPAATTPPPTTTPPPSRTPTPSPTTRSPSPSPTRTHR
jgi:hypothetical protein